MRIFAEDFLYFFLNFRHPGHTADQNDFADFVGFKPGVGQGLAAGFDRAFDQVVDQRFQFGAGEFDVEVFRSGGVGSDKRQVDVGLSGRGQFDLGFFRRFFQTLQSQTVVFQINAAFFFELVGQIVDDALVKVFAAEESVAVGGFYFKNAVADFQNGNIERAAAQVINRDGAVFVLVQAVSQSGRGRLVDDTQNVKPRDFAGVFGRLTLRIVEIGRNGNDRLVDFFAQIAFGIFLNLLQNDCRNLRRRIFLSLDFYPGVAVVAGNDFKRNQFLVLFDFRRIVTAADQTLDGKQGVFRVGNGLTFCRRADQAFVVGKGNDRRRGAGTLAVFQHLGFSAFHNRKAGVCRTKVNTYNFIAHNLFLRKFNFLNCYIGSSNFISNRLRYFFCFFVAAAAFSGCKDGKPPFSHVFPLTDKRFRNSRETCALTVPVGTERHRSGAKHSTPINPGAFRKACKKKRQFFLSRRRMDPNGFLYLPISNPLLPLSSTVPAKAKSFWLQE